jgi:hypothetical protein
MTRYKIILTYLLITTVFSCGKNEQVEKADKEIKASETSKEVKEKTVTINPEIDLNTKATIATGENKVNPSKIRVNNGKKYDELATEITTETTIIKEVTTTNSVEKIINSPLHNLLNTGQIGKSYTKNELIKDYKFPKEAVDLIKQVTYVGKNQLYFKWGSTWFVEKISDAKFQNGTMTFEFKENKTYVSGGAIGIKYNRKLYTDLILNNGTAYIPTVKGYHWEIGKK